MYAHIEKIMNSSDEDAKVSLEAQLHGTKYDLRDVWWRDLMAVSEDDTVDEKDDGDDSDDSTYSGSTV